MAIELQIRKKPDNVWEHIKVSDGSVTIFSDFFVRWNGTTMEISEPNGNDNFRYNIIQVAVYDDTSGGNEETFTDSLVMASRLKELGYPAYKQVIIQDRFYEDLSVSGTFTVDYSNYETYRLTLTGNTVINETNIPNLGDSKPITLYIDGNFNLDFPTDWKIYQQGNYNGLNMNRLVVEVVKPTFYSFDVSQIG